MKQSCSLILSTMAYETLNEYINSINAIETYLFHLTVYIISAHSTV